MSKLWDWMRKRGKSASALAAARAKVEQAQRALLPFSSALQGRLHAQIQEAEHLWREARAAEERGDEESCDQALRGFERAAAELRAVRQTVLAEHPELVARELLARAEELLPAMGEAAERCQAALKLLSVYGERRDEGAAERLLASDLEHLLESSPPAQLVELVRVCFYAEKQLGARAGFQDGRTRALARLHEWDASDPEREGWLLLLLEVQAEWDDIAGARATLAILGEDFREQGLQELVAAHARGGAFDEARAALASIHSVHVRRRAAVSLIDALARSGKFQDALAAARGLADARTRSMALAKIAGARAHAGELDAALALLVEVEADWQDEVQLEVLEGQLERGDLRPAEQRIENFVSHERRALARSRVAEELVNGADYEHALSFALMIPEPFTRAETLESLALRRIHEGDEETARALFGRALEVVGEAARTQSPDPTHPSGSVGPHWIRLACRIQSALGDSASALVCATGFHDPDQRAAGLLDLGLGCGGMGDLTGIDVLLEKLASPIDRTWLLHGAVHGLNSRPKAR